jgi:hypothetical protein
VSDEALAGLGSSWNGIAALIRGSLVRSDCPAHTETAWDPDENMPIEDRNVVKPKLRQPLRKDMQAFFEFDAC